MKNLVGLQYLKKLKEKFNLDIEIIPTKFKFLSVNKNIPLNVTMNNNKIKKKLDLDLQNLVNI